MPTCKKCGYATDDIDEFVEHKIQERNSELEKPTPRHRTLAEAKGFLKCPECRKSFIQAFKEDPKFLEEIKPQEEKREQKKKGFLL